MNQVLLRMGFVQSELDNHFGGAAFLAWLVDTTSFVGNVNHSCSSVSVR